MVNIDGNDIVLDQAEKLRVFNSSSRCPFLKQAPLIPFADKFYAYCDIRHGPSDKRAIDKSYIYFYCCNENAQLAFMGCKIWKELPDSAEGG